MFRSLFYILDCATLRNLWYPCCEISRPVGKRLGKERDTGGIKLLWLETATQKIFALYKNKPLYRQNKIVNHFPIANRIFQGFKIRPNRIEIRTNPSKTLRCLPSHRPTGITLHNNIDRTTIDFIHRHNRTQSSNRLFRRIQAKWQIGR